MSHLKTTLLSANNIFSAKLFICVHFSTFTNKSSVNAASRLVQFLARHQFVSDDAVSLLKSVHSQYFRKF